MAWKWSWPNAAGVRLVVVLAAGPVWKQAWLGACAGAAGLGNCGGAAGGLGVGLDIGILGCGGVLDPWAGAPWAWAVVPGKAPWGQAMEMVLAWTGLWYSLLGWILGDVSADELGSLRAWGGGHWALKGRLALGCLGGVAGAGSCRWWLPEFVNGAKL